uniref:Uncharacterized protein n=1 Tax=Anguilla anguilla TaxID=7936 RepID=A0A0E9SLY7_ANGAN
MHLFNLVFSLLLWESVQSMFLIIPKMFLNPGLH